MRVANIGSIVENVGDKRKLGGDGHKEINPPKAAKRARFHQKDIRMFVNTGKNSDPEFGTAQPTGCDNKIVNSGYGATATSECGIAQPKVSENKDVNTKCGTEVQAECAECGTDHPTDKLNRKTECGMTGDAKCGTAHPTVKVNKETECGMTGDTKCGPDNPTNKVTWEPECGMTGRGTATKCGSDQPADSVGMDADPKCDTDEPDRDAECGMTKTACPDTAGPGESGTDDGMDRGTECGMAKPANNAMRETECKLREKLIPPPPPIFGKDKKIYPHPSQKCEPKVMLKNRKKQGNLRNFVIINPSDSREPSYPSMKSQDLPQVGVQTITLHDQVTSCGKENHNCGDSPQEGGEGGYAVAGKVGQAGKCENENVSLSKYGKYRQALDRIGGEGGNLQQNNVRGNVETIGGKMGLGGRENNFEISEAGNVIDLKFGSFIGVGTKKKGKIDTKLNEGGWD